MDNYFVKDDKGENGPFTFDELTDGRLEPDDLVRTPLSNWTKAGDLPEFVEYFRYEGYYFPTFDNLAGFGIRSLAFVIDYFIIGLIVRVELSMFAAYIPVDKLSKLSLNGTVNPEDLNDVLKIEVAFLVTIIIYSFICYITPLSATLGQYMCKLVVVDEGGEKLTFKKALTRSFARALSCLFFGAGFWFVFFTEYKQCLHDKLAKTFVVRKDVY
ncbi:RDD family protein [Mucilaginibacter sp. Bleaf8]|uniref:RDD family protein n=1 Tax=Mucilaginibacter sp. Bleaf8 TaxID=2834430 RepID=UPI001BCC69FA|nr:RDD family protein [Mucilaginibacter sp. Bleaf8]MBS7564281.1 RDD family protein [Mucilaginibacter sp. Bleaf8]